MEFLEKQEKTQPSMLLESQILYRLGKMDACVDICRNLQRAKIDSLEINLVAGLILAERASEVQGTLDTFKVKATSSFELAYNVACSLIEGNKHKDAEQLLLTARRYCIFFFWICMMMRTFSCYSIFVGGLMSNVISRSTDCLCFGLVLLQ